jgi:HAD superfamily hydrolase (TIGR01459 family)
MSIQIIDGLGQIADDYGLFVIDQWGVLHDGETAHPGAVDAMENLRALADRTGAGIALLSNSGKRVDASYERLEALGIARRLYDFVLTSGEQVYQGLRQRGQDSANDPFYASLGSRFVGFWWDDDRGILEGCDVEEVADVDQADFILCSGTDRGALEAYRPTLARALARDLPMTCANPDRVSVQPDGSLKMCPGAVAEAYEQMGGRVRWHGKPQPQAYDVIREHFGFGPEIKGLGIGDSLQHDIQGAIDSDLDGLFIAGGIHRQDLSRPLKQQEMADLATQRGVQPTFAADLFRW